MNNTNISTLPESFHHKIIGAFGDLGKEWLYSLPALLSDCEQRLDLKIGAQLRHLSYGFVANAIQSDGTEIIIKAVVSVAELSHEIKALELMSGPGMVDLLHADKIKGILLLEKLMPGETLATLESDSEATCIAAEVMQKLWRLDNHQDFPSTQQWFEWLAQPINASSIVSPSLIDRARKISEELHQSMSEPVLLHGDLHHFNILSAARQPWLAIDPK
ncbi:MAG: aminoglycoside phosphotransferase family protein, partial [Gammaproteobacteria bacterium]